MIRQLKTAVFIIIIIIFAKPPCKSVLIVYCVAMTARGHVLVASHHAAV